MSPVCEVWCKVSPKTPINFLMCSNVRPRQPTYSIIILISRKNLLINLQLTFLLVVLTSEGAPWRKMAVVLWWLRIWGTRWWWLLASFYRLGRHLFLIVVVFRVAINHLMRSWNENFSNEDRELQIRNYLTLLERGFQTFLVNPVYFQSITLPNNHEI